MLTLAQTPTKPAIHSGSWSSNEIWVVLLIPILIISFLGLVFVQSRKRHR